MQYRVKCESDDPRDAGNAQWVDITEEFRRLQNAGEIPVISDTSEIIEWMQRFALPGTRVTVFEAGGTHIKF